MIGAELGYRYVDSPIIADIPGGPEHRFRTYEPTTWPGARLPHVWLNDGTGIQDHIAEGRLHAFAARQERSRSVGARRGVRV